MTILLFGQLGVFAEEVVEVADTGTHVLDGPLSVRWVSRLTGQAMHDDTAYASALSPNGRFLFVTGVMATSEPRPSNVDPTWDAVTVAYDTISGFAIWSSVKDFGRSDIPWWMVLSSDGQTIYIAGRSIQGYGEQFRQDLMVYALDATTGATLWESVADTPSEWEQAHGLVLNREGTRLFITGRTTNERNFDYLTLACDTRTGTVIWRDIYNGDFDLEDSATSLALSPEQDALYVTGSSRSRLSQYPRGDFATLAYDAETGERRWLRRFYRTPSSSDGGSEVLVSPDGSEVLVVGGSEDFDNHDPPEILILVYRAADGMLKRVSSHPRFDRPKSIGPVVLGHGGRHLFIAGSNSRNGGDLMVLAIDVDSAEEIWKATWDRGVGGEDWPFRMVASQGGQTLILTGGTNESSKAVAISNFVTMEIDATTGQILWAARYNGPGAWDDFPTSIASSPSSRRLFVSGYSEGSIGLPGRRRDYLTVAYDLPPMGRRR